MSLILEALRKLDREKNAPQRGFMVLASPVTARSRSWTAPRAVAVATVVGLGAVMAVLLATHRQRPPGPVSTTQTSPALLRAASPGPAAGTTRKPAPALRASAEATPMVAPPQRQAASPPAAAAAEEPRARAAATSPTLTPDQPGPDPTSAPLLLQAIAFRDGHRVAVLSGRLVREGDVFGATRVLRIGDSEVEIESDGQRRVLRF